MIGILYDFSGGLKMIFLDNQMTTKWWFTYFVLHLLLPVQTTLSRKLLKTIEQMPHKKRCKP